MEYRPFLFWILFIRINLTLQSYSSVNRYSYSSSLDYLSRYAGNYSFNYPTRYPSGYPSKPEYILKPDFEINQSGVIRRFQLVVSNVTGAPDGFSRPVLVINGQTPGPLIEVNEGDTLEVTVVNLLDDGLSIHWHGIHQNGTKSVWEDGITGITQCPIPERGGIYTYRFTINKQFGTFCNAHHKNLKADGIMGPLIVHSVRDPLKRGVHFDEEMVVMVTDWYHDQSSVVIDQMRSNQGYRNSSAAPSANSGLINGVGLWDCRFASTSERCKLNSPPEYTFAAGKRLRLRWINGGSHAMFYVSADRHTLNVVEADATAVYSANEIHRVKIHNGQRYSAIITLGSDEVGQSFWLRAVMETDCWVWVTGDIQLTALAVIRVISPGSEEFPQANQPLPTTTDWADLPDGSCTDLDSNTLLPILPVSVPSMPAGTGTFTAAFGFQSIATGAQVPLPPPSNTSTPTNSSTQSNSSAPTDPSTTTTSRSPAMRRRQVNVTPYDPLPPFGTATSQPPVVVNGGPPSPPAGTEGRFFVNNITYVTHPFQPVLYDVAPGGSGFVNSTSIASVEFPTAEWYDLILVSVDPIDHPFHLHGMDMHIVGTGQGLPTPENLGKVKYRTENPLRRDTVVVSGGSFLIARVLADLPGAWMMHCHMGWHLGVGFGGVVIVQRDKIAQFDIPQRSRTLCTNRGTSGGETQAG
ncbi:hypothetical protein CROQUDRAFT_678661 [Cronartium quercuum f. sp. fusiforme G11]|uniref:Laccase n=1 Tax=Cronartium quercuum f. sp. fusiforme G11 TaxID=708437 RepID=A0A9P6NGS4_9BASI|nr:hypothetical protein CROQUDRAFT_678661 [Cronartium quercuum f. sp. fusiforme G11]